MAMRQAMATPQGRSPITKAAIPGNHTMAAVTGMVIMGTATDWHLIFAYAKMPMGWHVGYPAAMGWQAYATGRFLRQQTTA
jgi:hypothetical protein